MGKYDFDCVIERRGTGAMKYDALTELFGRADITPLWIADMEFAAAPEIQNALVKRFNHPVYGYASTPDSYWKSIQSWLEKRHNFKVSREELTFVPGRSDHFAAGNNGCIAAAAQDVCAVELKWAVFFGVDIRNRVAPDAHVRGVFREARQPAWREESRGYPRVGMREQD